MIPTSTVPTPSPTQGHYSNTACNSLLQCRNRVFACSVGITAVFLIYIQCYVESMNFDVQMNHLVPAIHCPLSVIQFETVSMDMMKRAAIRV